MAMNTMVRAARGLVALACWASAAQVALATDAGARAGRPNANANDSAVRENHLDLAATGSVEVVQDELTLVLSVTQEGNDAPALQQQLQKAVDAATARARAAAQPGGMEVSSGGFGLARRLDGKNAPVGWTGTAQLVLRGTDFALITGTAGQINTMTIAGLSLALSPKTRATARQEAQTLAVAQFKQRAALLAQGFGFAGYGLRQVSVADANEPVHTARGGAPSVSTFSMKSEAPLPVVAGKEKVEVRVSGTVQLR